MSVRELVAAAVAELEQGEMHSCQHVIGAPSTRLLLCVRHPEVGLICDSCAMAHVQDHPVDRPCDFCGAEGGPLVAHGAEAVWSGRVRDELGQVGTVAAGVVHIFGAVTCAHGHGHAA